MQIASLLRLKPMLGLAMTVVYFIKIILPVACFESVVMR